MAHIAGEGFVDSGVMEVVEKGKVCRRKPTAIEQGPWFAV